MIVDGNKITLTGGKSLFSNTSPSYSRGVIFSEDGTHTAGVLICYVDGGIFSSSQWERVFVDGTVGAKYPFVDDPSFSPDGKHVVDGVEGKHYDSIVLPEPVGTQVLYGAKSLFGKVVFDDATHFHYIGIKDNKIYYVTEQITGN